jgi:hypothetical protein
VDELTLQTDGDALEYVFAPEPGAITVIVGGVADMR